MAPTIASRRPFHASLGETRQPFAAVTVSSIVGPVVSSATALI